MRVAMFFTNGFDEYDDEDEDVAVPVASHIHNDNTNNNNTNNNSNKNATDDDDDAAPGAVYQFTRKYQHYAIKNNPLCGICLIPWLRLLVLRYDDIDWSLYWHRIVAITMMSILNSILSIPERIMYEQAVRQTKIHDTPIFIIGHPRTGTTLLHGLLSLDIERFAYCNTFCAGFVHCFLWFEYMGKIIFRDVIDTKRPMDNVPLHFDLPQEDELATTVLTGGMASGYMPLYFMRQEPCYRSYYAFESSEPIINDGDDEAVHNDTRIDLAAADLAKARSMWIDSFLYLCRKLSYRDGHGAKPLLLKSPVHTARIRLLKSLFPDAKFIYLHRNPYDVFKSSCHMADTTYWYTYLCRTPTNEMIQEFILRQYEILWDHYERDRIELLSSSVSPDDEKTNNNTNNNKNQQLIEISYDELITDPVKTIQRIYETFGWTTTDFDHHYMKDRIVQETTNVTSSFRRNHHKELSPALCRIIEKRWKSSFERLGYPIRSDEQKQEE